MKLLVDNDAEFQKLFDQRPEGFPDEHLMAADRDGILWGLNSDNSACSEFLPSELAIELGKQLLREAIEYKLEVRQEGHPLLQQVRLKRFAVADVPGLLSLASEIIRWGQLMKKKGY